MDSTADLRRQLTDAVARVERQIELHRRSTGARRLGPADARVIRRLKAELADLKDALAGLRGLS